MSLLYFSSSNLVCTISSGKVAVTFERQNFLNGFPTNFERLGLFHLYEVAPWLSKVCFCAISVQFLALSATLKVIEMFPDVEYNGASAVIREFTVCSLVLRVVTPSLDGYACASILLICFCSVHLVFNNNLVVVEVTYGYTHCIVGDHTFRSFGWVAVRAHWAGYPNEGTFRLKLSFEPEFTITFDCGAGGFNSIHRRERVIA